MQNILELVRRHKLISILRGVPTEQIAPTALALANGGIKLLEITFDQRSADRLTTTAKAIALALSAVGDRMLIGAGTVLSVAEVDAAVAAGATFILSPNVDKRVICRALELGVFPVPGAFTPTELAAAYGFGAKLVKLFPAGIPGIDYIKAISAPLSHIPLLAVGGIDAHNMQNYLDAGAVGLGIGSNLAKNDWIAQGLFEQLTDHARTYVQAVSAHCQSSNIGGNRYEDYKHDTF